MCGVPRLFTEAGQTCYLTLTGDIAGWPISLTNHSKPNKSEVNCAAGLAVLHDLTKTTLNNGYLGSRNDEERSEMRYVV